jgi:hypothetical protein
MPDENPASSVQLTALAGHHSSVRSAQTNLAMRSGPRPGSV